MFSSIAIEYSKMKGLPFNTAEVLAWDPSLSSLAGLRDAIPFLKPEPKYNSKHVQLMGPATRAFDLEAFRKDVTKPVFQPTRDPQHLLATAVQLVRSSNDHLLLSIRSFLDVRVRVYTSVNL